jgi:uncharacterized protein YkwD
VRGSAGLALVLALALLSASCRSLTMDSAAPAATMAEGSSASAYDDAILALVNAHRQSVGQAALTKSQMIWAQANQHSRSMAAGAVAYGHHGFDARAGAIFAALGSTGEVGENVAMGYSSAESVVAGWLTSPVHRTNIEGSVTRTGVSAVQSSAGVWYYTQIFY